MKEPFFFNFLKTFVCFCLSFWTPAVSFVSDSFLFTTISFHWDFSHGKFGSLSLWKSRCDRVVLLNLRCMLGVLVFVQSTELWHVLHDLSHTYVNFLHAYTHGSSVYSLIRRTFCRVENLHKILPLGELADSMIRSPVQMVAAKLCVDGMRTQPLPNTARVLNYKNSTNGRTQKRTCRDCTTYWYWATVEYLNIRTRLFCYVVIPERSERSRKRPWHYSGPTRSCLTTALSECSFCYSVRSFPACWLCVLISSLIPSLQQQGFIFKHARGGLQDVMHCAIWWLIDWSEYSDA